MADDKILQPEIDPNSITKFDSTGLTLPTLADLIAQQNSNVDQIIPGINTDSNSPLGQQNAILSKLIFDTNAILAQIANSFNPQTAVGTQLDDLVSITNITRSPSTFSYQEIDVVINDACNLPGLDDDANNIDGTGFTISDNAGNNYILAVTNNGLTAGNYKLLFRAQNIGPVTSIPNSITNIVTSIKGVESVNNPSGPNTVGQTGETDAQLRQRQQLSPAMSSNGYVNGLFGFLASLTGIAYTVGSKDKVVPSIPILAIDNNTSNLTNGYGTPGHTVWVIILGGADKEIGEVMLNRISAGCGMRGNEVVSISDAQGNIIRAFFDRPTSQSIWLRFTLNNINGSSVGDEIKTPIINYLLANCIFCLKQVASLGNIMPFINDAIAELAPSQLTASKCEVSLDGNAWVGNLIPQNINIQFVLDSSQINITVIP